MKINLNQRLPPLKRVIQLFRVAVRERIAHAVWKMRRNDCHLVQVLVAQGLPDVRVNIQLLRVKLQVGAHVGGIVGLDVIHHSARIGAQDVDDALD